MFRRWFTLHERCAVCGLAFQARPGDTWGFWVLGDRILIAVTMVLLFVGFRPESWWLRGVFFLAVTVPLVGTMPHRMGMALGLDYLSRLRFGGVEELTGEAEGPGKVHLQEGEG